MWLMRAAFPILAVIIASGLNGCGHMRPRTVFAAAHAGETIAIAAFSSTVPPKVDFATQIRPILEARCQPCHFNGGKQYAHLPFDRAETIKFLGTKLFTRIKDEKEQRLIREFLAQ
ncbi:MAG: hypothetical protein JWM21_1131 [Acidobacteria bacterium]|jgi:hypothetical protein|nr:hypothetical protein [Acidobacteriota bacterium]